MKVALCLSGHFRTFYRTKPTWISEVEEKYSPDVFIHTWNTLGFGRPLADVQETPDLWDKNQKKVVDENAKYGDSRVEFCRQSPDLDDKVFSDVFSNVKKVVIEDYKDVEPEILAICKNIDLSVSPYFDYPPNFVSAQRKAFLCNELKKQAELDHGQKYDIVIKGRPDLQINNLNLTVENIGDHCFLPSDQAYHGVSDIFAVGASETIDRYCSFFSNVEKYIEEKLNFNPHTILSEHLRRQNVKYTTNGDICCVTLIRGK